MHILSRQSRALLVLLVALNGGGGFRTPDDLVPKTENHGYIYSTLLAYWNYP
jgi:hypothetical protein